MQDHSSRPNTADVRQFLTEAFSDEELTTLCFDYFPRVYDSFSPSMTKGHKVQLLLEYCQRRNIMPSLLVAAQKAQPEQYEKQFPQMPKAPVGPKPARLRQLSPVAWAAMVLLALLLLSVLAVGLSGVAGKFAVPSPVASMVTQQLAQISTPTIVTIPPGHVNVTPTPSQTQSPAVGATATPTMRPSSTPTLPPEPGGTPEPTLWYALPLPEPSDVIYDGSGLWVRFKSCLVKLELVEAEGRFRDAGQQICPTPVSSLTWDMSRNAYWAVSGNQVDLLNRAGNRTTTFTVPPKFNGAPSFATWDGEHLWMTSYANAVYKLQLPTVGSELKIVDSYAPRVGNFSGSTASGLTWDGKNLWLLSDDVLHKLNQAAQPTCTIKLPWEAGVWHRWRGLTWDKRFLWVVNTDTNIICRVDPNACR